MNKLDKAGISQKRKKKKEKSTKKKKKWEAEKAN